jgi:HlyD family secretion protein
MIGLLAVLFLYGCGGPTEVEGIKPRKGDIRESFSEPARTRLAKTYPIAMPVAGRIVRIDLEPGDPVKKGQVLAKYDLVPFQEAVAEAQAVIRELEAQIVVKDDNRLEETMLSETRATVKAAAESLNASAKQTEAERANAEHAQRNLGRMKRLAGEKTIPESDLDDAQLRADTADIALKRQEFYHAALNALTVAVNLGPSFVEKYILRKGLERATLMHQVAEAKARLARAQHDLELADIRSPMDGVVLERNEQGDRTVAVGQVLLLVGNLDDLEVIADVLTQDALRIGVGSEVSLEPALGIEQKIAGKVKRIEPQGFTKLSSLGVEQQRVNVIVSLEKRREGLGVGYRMQARFFTGSKTEALIVPRFSVLQAPDRSYYVFKISGDRLKRQPVTIGLRGDLELEITSGLSPSDTIVAEPDTTMKDGTTVTVRKQ